MEIDEYRRMAAAERSHWWYAATRALLETVLAPHLGGEPRILDAGCGTGAAGGFLTRHGTVVGADVEPLALAFYREARPGAPVVTADLARLPLRTGSFDAALCVTVLYHRRVSDPAVSCASSRASFARAACSACSSPRCRASGARTIESPIPRGASRERTSGASSSARP
jgi:SAM-dependent methyltransferase